MILIQNYPFRNFLAVESYSFQIVAFTLHLSSPLASFIVAIKKVFISTHSSLLSKKNVKNEVEQKNISLSKVQTLNFINNFRLHSIMKISLSCVQRQTKKLKKNVYDKKIIIVNYLICSTYKTDESDPIFEFV